MSPKGSAFRTGRFFVLHEASEDPPCERSGCGKQHPFPVAADLIPLRGLFACWELPMQQAGGDLIAAGASADVPPLFGLDVCHNGIGRMREAADFAAYP